MAQAIERIGYDHIDIFDHVVMGHPMEGRPPGPYNAAMPIIEALMGLSYLAAVTSRVTLGHRGAGAAAARAHAGGQADQHARHALRRPRAPGHRRRLAGVGVRGDGRGLPHPRRSHGRGDPAAAHLLGRGARGLRRQGLPRGGDGDGAQAAAGRARCRSGSAATPRPRSAASGASATAGWPAASPTPTTRGAASTRSGATRRRPGAIPARSGCRAWSRRHRATPRASASTPSPSASVARAVELQKMGFGWISVNATAMFQAGARSVDAMIDALNTLHGRLRAVVG